MAALRALLDAGGASPPLPPTATIGTGEPDQTIPSTAAVVGGETVVCLDIQTYMREPQKPAPL